MYGIFHIRSVSVGLDSQIWYLFIYITGYLNVRKISETIPLVYRLFYFFQNSIDQQVEKVSKAMKPRNILLFKEEKKMIYVCSLKISDLRQSRQSLVSHHFAEGNGGGGGGSGGAAALCCRAPHAPLPW